METMKTPGVYVVEKNAFPNSVVEVETAIPVFIGYTEKFATPDGVSLKMKPRKINSLNEYHTYFGGAPKPKFTIHTTAQSAGNPLHIRISDKEYWITSDNKWTFYYNLMLFFANGGGPCYILSVGDYKGNGVELDKLWNDDVKKELAKQQEPTMLVIPEAVNLPADSCYNIQTSMVEHCAKMKNRIALLDVFMTGSETTMETCIKNFREKVKESTYGAAYFPWLATSVLSDNDVAGEMISFENGAAAFIAYAKPAEETALKAFLVCINAVEDSQKAQMIHQAFLQSVEAYKLIVSAIKEKLNLLPPSAAMAGACTMVDNTRGVWKAPANISLNAVVKPSISLTDKEQEGLNVPDNGHSINAIRSFINSGVKVWGARTLMGKDLDFRYINVRRTMIFLEESIKNASRPYVFEPNDTNTWLNMKCMIENFLRGVWKRGGLVGASTDEAFSVHIGLGETMTPEDILEGIMRISVLVAISHPAEFIEITFQQQMQKS